MIYLFILLLRAVAYLEGPAKIYSFMVVFAIISYSTLKRSTLKYHRISSSNFYIIALSVGILAHGLVFGKILVRDLAVLMTYWIWFVFTLSYFRSKTITQCLRYMLVAFLIYNIANYAFFELYFADQRAGFNSILRVFGFEGYRIYFPLSSGANVFTFQVGVNAMLALYFLKLKSWKALYLAIYGFYIFLLVLADSRLILLFTLMFSAIYWFRWQWLIKLIKNNWEFIAVSIIVAIFIFYKTPIFDDFKRPGELSGAALSRIDIWGFAMNTIFDGPAVLFGHGLNGFEMSHDETIKAAFEEESLQTAHNFFIQNIIDFGLAGLVLILFLLYKILVMVVRLNVQIITVLFVMFLMIGTTESIPTFYSFDATIFFIALLSILIAKNERKINRHSQDSDVLPAEAT